MTEAAAPYTRHYATIDDFIARWQTSGAGERANCQPFLSELCDQLQVPRPDPSRPDDRENAYVFERTVLFHHGDGSTSSGRIDLYKRGCFVLEAKQGSDRHTAEALVREFTASRRRGTAVRGTAGWDDAMLAARGQAEQYARALPKEEGWPPFLVVVDVGHSLELYSEFSCSGKTYLPFPDPRSHRLRLTDLRRPEIRERLRLVWSEPHRLDPARHSAKVTREVADRLARLAKSFEQSGHPPEKVGDFLKRCLFTMFAEDVALIPEGSFTGLLASLRGEAGKFAPLAESLWQTMRDGGFSPVLRGKLLRFNGGLFAEAEALPLSEQQLALLIEAGKADWKDVEPAIFGTLLERALDPRERHNLGAHYTPREYVERLVLPTVVEPLRADWEAVLAAAVTLARQGKLDEAVTEVKEFHRKLCAVRVLDPACGSGNFLYVTFEHLKRLEGEVLNALEDFGETQAVLDLAGSVVDPHQLLGIEINPRAAAITDMVLWIGYLQWHFRTRGNILPPEPVIKKFRNIECRDAVLACDAREPVVDADGQPVTLWDGRTTKAHPVTGEQVPDETARMPLYRYVNARRAEWPETDFVVGNPPFIGNWRMRSALGDGYVEALRKTYTEVPESTEFVMYWWHKAAELTRLGKVRRFGFITTNSLPQTFNRKVVQAHLAAKPPLSLIFAIPDHPWVDSADGAAVRIAMTAGAAGALTGKLGNVVEEIAGDGEGLKVRLAERQGPIFSDLTIGADVAGAVALRANTDLSNRGVCLFGAGFIVSPEEAGRLGLGRVPGVENHIRHYRNGRDIAGSSRNAMVIDLFGLSEYEVLQRFPEIYQWVLERVKPERDNNNRESRKKNWWLFGETNPKLRKQLQDLSRFIATVETAKHRFFVFLDRSILPDNMLVNIASEDAYHLGVLSSRIHVVWALAAGGRLGVGNDPRYNKTRCFETFPFPDCVGAPPCGCPDLGQAQGPAPTTIDRIRALGEALDTHRKRQQALHPDLTMTGMYNVLERLREIECRGGIHAAHALADEVASGGAMNRAPTVPLTAKEREIHEKGLVSVLRQLHDDLDAAVFAAYGWPANLADEEILERLVALNRERAREEEQGLIRWLRPEFQNPQGGRAGVQEEMEIADETVPATAVEAKQPWPKTLPEQVQAVRAALAGQPPVTAKELAKAFERAKVDKVQEILETLASLGQVREVGGGSYVV